MDDRISGFKALRAAAVPEVADAIERAVRDGDDSDLVRINALAFAERHGLDEEAVIAGFLHAASLGLFDLSWNVLCPGCGGVLDTNASLKTLVREEYVCSLCAAGYQTTLDELVEVTFTVSPRVRAIAAHRPDSLPLGEFLRQLYWGSGVVPPGEDFADLMSRVIIDDIELGPGEKGVLTTVLPQKFVIVFEVVTHTAQFIDVKGEPTTERQTLSLAYDREHRHSDMLTMRPGPLRITIENRTDGRVLPAVMVADHDLHDFLTNRRPFVTAKRLLTNQTFRDLYRTDTVDVDQRLRITSLTFLFTDLRGSTGLYERVGDLAAFDLVREHFSVLQGIVAMEAGAVVKTIGDAVMATFASPDRAVAAALRMREAMADLNRRSGREEMLLKIGIHEGPCIAVSMNERQDYFGQTVNIASRVQSAAEDSAIFVTGQVVENDKARALLSERRVVPQARNVALRGIDRDFQVYALP